MQVTVDYLAVNYVLWTDCVENEDILGDKYTPSKKGSNTVKDTSYEKHSKFC